MGLTSIVIAYLCGLVTGYLIGYRYKEVIDKKTEDGDDG